MASIIWRNNRSKIFLKWSLTTPWSYYNVNIHFLPEIKNLIFSIGKEGKLPSPLFHSFTLSFIPLLSLSFLYSLFPLFKMSTLLTIDDIDYTGSLLKQMQENGGLENVILEESQPLHVLKALVGSRTRVLSIDGITNMNHLVSLETSQLKSLTIRYCGNVKTFEPLQRMQLPELTHLNLHGFEGSSLKSIAGLRLLSLTLTKFPNIDSLDFLKEMNLTELTLINFPQVSSLEPLRCLTRLIKLDLQQFPLVSSFSPLRALRPTSLSLCKFPEVESLEALSEMSPTILILKNITEVSSLEHIRRMRPTTLVIEYLSEVESLDALSEMSPTTLILHFFSHVSSLDPLQNMLPETLHLSSFPDVTSLGPLSNMSPTTVEIHNFPKLNLTDLFKTFVSRG